MSAIGKLQSSVQRHLLWVLVACYALGIVWPGPGLWIRGVDLVGPGADGQRWALLDVMLALLLFNAGLGLDRAQLSRLRSRVSIVVPALLAGFVVPLAFVLLAGLALSPWLTPSSLYGLVMGLAVVAAMPVAGSSTAWSQNTDGNVALSLGLVLCSTLISPVTASITLTSAAKIIGSGFGGELATGPSRYVAVFLTLWVLLPALAGVLLNRVIGNARVARWIAVLKLSNLVILIVLNYTNASLSLPASVHRPDAVLMSLTVLLSVALCVTNFMAGGVVARLTRVDRSPRASLIFGLGMKNNGAGLVLIATVFPANLEIMLPVITYNVAQHAMAAIVSRRALRARTRESHA